MAGDFWAGKKVFVTGITGFKGTWLTSALDSFGARVTGVDIVDVGAFRAVNPGIPFEICDVRDAPALRRVLESSGPDVVFHLAAQPIVSVSYDNPVETFTTNVLGTVNVLEAVRTIDSARALVVVTSDKCYRNTGGATGGFREDSPLGGDDPYSASKACQEIVTQSYIRSFLEKLPLRAATARAGNAIGGGDFSKDRLVPDIVRCAQRGGEIVLRHPEAIRPWQHVLEPIAGYMLLAERLWQGRTATAYNFSSETAGPVTVGELAAWFLEALGLRPAVRVVPSSFEESAVLTLDASKARRELGWTPRLGTREAVRLTAAWYRAYLDSEDVGALTRRQIEEYFQIR